MTTIALIILIGCGCLGVAFGAGLVVGIGCGREAERRAIEAINDPHHFIGSKK